MNKLREIGMHDILKNDTICAISTPGGVGGIAVIRVSGPQAMEIADSVWTGKRLSDAKSHTAHLGTIIEQGEDEPLDQAVATVFKAPNSFTGEDVVEFSVHGSRWIQRELVNLLIRQGCRLAEPGEFTRRAFGAGKLDLAQAEAVADVIASSSKSAHRLASSQMRGVFSKNISELRDRLIKIASLLELELDFSEEEVEFASRSELKSMARSLQERISRLASTFATGNAIKGGVPVAIVGEPNVGKSTLLNRLLDDDRAIVSDVPGTTRDTVEDTADIDGVMYRFIDTAGIRETDDTVENMGIQRTLAAVSKARIVVWIVTPDILPGQFKALSGDILKYLPADAKVIIAVNKMDKAIGEDMSQYDGKVLSMVPLPECEGGSVNIEVQSCEEDSGSLIVSSGDDVEGYLCLAEVLLKELPGDSKLLFMSAAHGKNMDGLKVLLKEFSGVEDTSEADMVVTNARHYEALVHAKESLNRVLDGIESGISGDFIAQDLRETIHHIGSITGSITTDDLLKSIFENFCIGK